MALCSFGFDGGVFGEDAKLQMASSLVKACGSQGLQNLRRLDTGLDGVPVVAPQLGGAAATADIAFGDAPLPMFDDPPKCWLHRQASFITAFFGDAEAGVDYDWFPFPEIETPGGPLFAGELAVVFSDRPEVVDFLERFMAEDVQCAMGTEPGSSRISPNVNVGPDCYPNPILASASEVLTAGLESGEGRFDAGDQMPPQVGSGAFWTEMMVYMQEGPGSLKTVLDDIEASWPAA